MSLARHGASTRMLARCVQTLDRQRNVPAPSRASSSGSSRSPGNSVRGDSEPGIRRRSISEPLPCAREYLRRASARTPRRSHRMRDRACARAQCRGRPRSAYGRHCVSCLSARALCCNFPMRRSYPAFGACAFVAACATAPPPPPAAAGAGRRRRRRRSSRSPRAPFASTAATKIARLRQEIASRDAELQGPALEPARAGQGRAGVHPRSHACESENAQARHAGGCGLLPRGGRGRAGGRAREQVAARSPLLALAQAFLGAAQPLFAQADYGAAMDRAAQAEQLVTAAAEGTPAASRPRVAGEVLLQVSIPLKASAESRLRREPRRAPRSSRHCGRTAPWSPTPTKAAGCASRRRTASFGLAAAGAAWPHRSDGALAASCGPVRATLRSGPGCHPRAALRAARGRRGT